MPDIVGYNRVGTAVYGQIKHQVVVWVWRQGAVTLEDLHWLCNVFQLLDETRYLPLRAFRRREMIASKSHRAILASDEIVQKKGNFANQYQVDQDLGCASIGTNGGNKDGCIEDYTHPPMLAKRTAYQPRVCI